MDRKHWLMMAVGSAITLAVITAAVLYVVDNLIYGGP